MVAFCCAPSFAQEAGKVSRVLPEGFLRRAGATAEVKAADPVLWQDIVRTNLQGRVRIALNDGSVLTVGAKSELRIVKHDTQSRQSLVEVLYGGLRARVRAITQKGGSFQVRTPTAVVGVIGTEFFVDATPGADWDPALKLAAAPAQPPDRQREQPQSLSDIPPGATPGGGGVSIADFAAVAETFVLGIDRVTAVRNIEPQVTGIVFLLPGEYTVVRRGMPPTPPRPASGSPDAPPWPEALQRASMDCFQWLDLSRPMPEGPQAAKVKIVGRGTSTGQVFEVQVENPGNCPVDVFMPHGAVLKPKGFLGRVVKGILLGSGLPPLKDFQMMMTEGGADEFAASAVPVAGGMRFVAQEKGVGSFLLRGFCLELHKLPPHQKTEYKLADADDNQKFASHRALISRAHQMFYERKITPQRSSLDSVIQWSVWASREKMDQKEFEKEYMKLVEQNYKTRKMKWDKKAKQDAQASAEDLWAAVRQILAEK
jgi:hypothetical protein